MTTFATIITQARALLQDVDATRYSDADLLVYANDALKMIRRIRPDVFIGKFKTPLAEYASGDTVPVGIEFDQAIRDYVVAYANMREAEAAGTTQDFMGKFAAGLKTL